MIPASILLKTNPAEIEINGVKLKTSVVENPAVASTYIKEFKALIQNDVVGFDVKMLQCGSGDGSSKRRAYGVVCVGTRCLVFLSSFEMFCAGFDNFLNHHEFCFVGTNVRMKVQLLIDEAVKMDWLSCTTTVDIGYFVSRVLMRGELEKCGLRELATALGIKTEDRKLEAAEPSSSGGTAGSVSQGDQELHFSVLENLKSVVEEAYACWFIANKAIGAV